MKKFLILLGITSLFLVGCEKKEENNCKFSKDDMVTILTDLELLETKLIKMNSKRAVDTLVELKEQVYSQHNTSEKEFEACIGAYFDQNPLDLKEIYEEVYEKIEKMEEE